MDDFKRYEQYMKSRPHVVILGAGASCAAIPHGDKNGKKISAMSGFMDILGMNVILEGIKLCTSSDNLEEVYMELDDRKSEGDVYASWEDFIFNYHFSYHNNFFNTTLGRCPRRSCEATFDRLMKSIFLDGSRGFKDDMDFDDIWGVINGLVAEESEKRYTGELLSNPYV